MLILIFILWYLIGICSFIYWWTTEFDLTTQQIPIMLLAGIMGPVAFLSGMQIHSKKDTILIKKRK